MAEKPILMPKMGESIAEATIIRWLKNEGDRIEKDEPIVEIATDKVDSEIPSTESGILVKILHPEQAVVKVGEPVALIATEGASTTAPVSNPVMASKHVESAAAVIEKDIQNVSETTKPLNAADGSRFYSPLVMNIARTEGIGMEELESIAGTGKDNRIYPSSLHT